MSSWFVRRAMHWLILGCLSITLAGAPLGVAASDQKTDTQKKKSDGKGSAKTSTGAKSVDKSGDADKLSNERMSTRGLHKGGDKSKPGGESSNKSASSGKPDSQK